MHIVLAVLLFFGVKTDALKCYQCDHLAHPKDCEHLMECKQNEVCYVEGNVTDTMELKYTSGCLTNNTCEAILHTDTGQQHLIGKRNTRFCRICCDKDFCNTELCDRKDITASPGPRCMNCKSTEDPRRCLQETQCRKEETCFTVESSVSPIPKYDMGCAPKRDCMIGYASQTHVLVGRTTACSQCCLGDHCNLHLCTGESVVQSHHLYTNAVTNTSCFDLNQEMCNYMINIQGHSCTDVNIVRMCKKTCNKCETYTSCADTTEFDCAVAARHFNICENLENSKRSCPFFCDYCKPVDGSWSSWLPWEQCISTECNDGEGKQKRRRRCANPLPSHGGVPCAGAEEDIRNCTILINGGWTSWSQWGDCVGSCGYGNMIRTRSCTNPSPRHGGPDCAGNTYDTKSCLYSGCPVNGAWSDWSPWSHCSKTCGSGTSARTRSCSNPAPVNNGTFCIGSTTETQQCFLIDCPGIRLVGGGSSGSGRLEIYYNGSWGTVCDDFWENHDDAIVVCRMLGYRNGTAKSGAFFGSGTGTIWLDDVRCLGNETSIIHCLHAPWGKHDCRHTEDVGVICTN